jgi:hypothetical protein
MNNDKKIKLVNENGAKKSYARIPDLWHAAMYIEELVQDHPGLADVSEQILEVWHMAHDLKSVAERQGEARITEVSPETPDPIASDLAYVIELAQHRADMWADVAGGGYVNLDCFHESDADELHNMSEMTGDAVANVSKWFGVNHG